MFVLSVEVPESKDTPYLLIEEMKLALTSLNKDRLNITFPGMRVEEVILCSL